MSYIAIKAHVMRSEIIKSETYRRMLLAKNLRDAVSILSLDKGGIWYYEKIAQIEPNEPKLLNRVIYDVFLNKVTHLLSSVRVIGDKYLRVYMVRYIESLVFSLLKASFWKKRIEISSFDLGILMKLFGDKIKRLALLERPKEILEYYFSLIAYNKSEAFIENILSIASNLKDTFFLEAILRKSYYISLFNKAKETTTDVLINLTGIEIDITNIYNLLVARSHNYPYNLIDMILIPNGLKITRNQLIRYYMMENISEIPQIYQPLIVNYVQGNISENIGLEYKIYLKHLQNITVRDPVSIPYVVYILKLLEIEKYNLQLILNSFLYGLDKENIGKKIILY